METALVRQKVSSRKLCIFSLGSLSLGILSIQLVMLVIALVASPVGYAAEPIESASQNRLPDAFKRARDVIADFESKNRSPKKKKKKRDHKFQYVESAAIEMMQANPKLLELSKEQLIAEIQERATPVDPTKHVRLVPPKGIWGYEDLKVYFSHPLESISGGLTPADDLVKVWRDFIAQAKVEIVLNVFEFDLKSVADDLIQKSKSGVKVRVGIDRSRVEMNPAVASIFDLLKHGGVEVHAVDSVGLNHQKMIAIDWSDLKNARVLFSSGNLTRSCLAPLGDLDGIVDKPSALIRPFAIPNANHVITMKSWLAANLVEHELSKTLDPQLALRGRHYPTTGSYQITGPGVPPETFEAFPNPSFIISFTPGGGYRSVGKNLLVDVIKRNQGPIRMIQFAFSSEEVGQALLERARRDHQEKGEFDFLSVGDTSFAMRPWSQFLRLAGLKYLQPKIRIAPTEYGRRDFQLKVGGQLKSIEVSAKVHHKIISVGEYAVIGSSFNFSRAAEKNNEQILIFHSPDLVKKVDLATRFLAARSPRSVAEEGQRRRGKTSFRFDSSGDSKNVDVDRAVRQSQNSL